jgi:2-iminobutanoate/2-iminopropanoate deaminase
MPAPGGRRGGPDGPSPEIPEPEAIRTPAVIPIAGYSSAVKIGLTVYLAGQVGMDANGEVVSSELHAQAAQAVRNAIAIVHAAHGATGDIVKLTFYYVPDSPENAAQLVSVVEDQLSTRHPPALTLVPVASLPRPGLRVAVDGVAILRGEFADRGRGRD